MRQIRARGAFKPHGAAVSVVEHALWDLAGKAAGVPVYKLLGGKVRDRVRVYNGAVRLPLKGERPEDYAETVAYMKAAKEGFTIVKQAIAFHSDMKRNVARLRLWRHQPGARSWRRRRPGAHDRARPQAHRSPASRR